MSTQYFLGANSKGGFVSLYEGFAAAPGDRLHIVKGGPGTGKSGFMRRIGEAAEKRGYAVEYVLCSGDPGSLDGVYIPALRQGWADGTAPHRLEPSVFGAAGDYVNLGRFCRLPLGDADAAETRRLTAAYQAQYARAYAFLDAAAALRRGCLPQLWEGETRVYAEKRLRALLGRFAAARGAGAQTRRFLSALSCSGELRLCEEIARLCPAVYELDDELGLAAPALRFAVEEAKRRSLDAVVCPSPLDPEEIEALLLPGTGLALLRGGWGVPGARHMRLDTLVPAETRRALR
ncbi:MAG: hypothetical protein IJJ43_03720, partial [Oscillospiraceae bacterium]|nr:hypothetical protein [Oscillospiraceae bacterium]